MYKKFLMGIAAMVALTLVSCSSDDLNSLSDNSSKNEAISFDGYLGRSAVAVNGSRGSVVDINALKSSTESDKKGFGVFGYYSTTDHSAPEQSFDANLFNNERVTCPSADNKWTYENTKYWPTEGHIDFLAYAPYVETPNFNGSSIDFTVENNVAAQKDLLWAKAENQTKANNSGANKVKFKFAHALSKLGYTVKLKEDYKNVTIKLKKITLAGSTTEPTKKAFYTKGTIDLSKTSSDAELWTKPTPAEKQNFDWFSGEKSVTSTSESNPNTDYLFVIPQDFSNTDELYVIVEYTIQNGETGTMTSTVSSKIEGNFEQGKAYTINLTIGLTPIEFDVDNVITPWVDGNTIPEIHLN